MALSLFSTLLAAGLAWALTITPSSEVQSGYFRSCVLVVFGLVIVSLLAGWSYMTGWQAAVLAVAAGNAYCGFVCFHLERLSAARIVLIVLSAVLFLPLLFAAEPTSQSTMAFNLANELAGAALLGVSMAAMLLGHYYLTAPWMSLLPLQRLVLGILAAGGCRAGVELCRVFGTPFVSAVTLDSTMDWVFYVGFRWIVGVAGPIILAVLTWQTLKIKATQAATGILYVAVIFTLIGEVTGVAMRYLGGNSL